MTAATLHTAFDADDLTVIDELRAALAASGMTQFAFAEALGTSPSRFSAYLNGKTMPSARLLIRARRIGAALRRAREERVPTAFECAASLRTSLENAERPGRTLRLVSETRDRLRDTLENRPYLASAWAAKASTGDERWDALFTAIVEHEFARAGQAAPNWSKRAPLTESWLPAAGFRTAEETRERTPEWLQERGIFIAAEDLAAA